MGGVELANPLGFLSNGQKRAARTGDATLKYSQANIDAARNMGGCDEMCPYEGTRCDGADGHGVLVRNLIHFHGGESPHTWNRETRELLNFDGSPLRAPHDESKLLAELRKEWKSTEENIPVGADEAVEDALRKYLDAREAQGSFSFRFTKIITKQDGTTRVEEVY